MKQLRLGFAIFLSITTVVLSLAPYASALSSADWQAGRIIDDSLFYNPSNISANDIQIFLNSKVPTCDTNGTQAYGGTTRAAYGASRGYPAPYTCLRDYTQDTPSKGPEAGLCNQYNGGVKSAAQIIYDVGVTCGINPRVLVVLLEKEESLVSDDWPWSIQYRSATGYGCPDTAPCDADYYGFFNQVYNAAHQFKRYQRDATYFSYRAQRTNTILYNPNTGCGSSDVFIQNQATAGLYNYTPYQPNGAALSDINGGGDGCSAFGNRNFWRLFNQWFGTVNGPAYFWQGVSQETFSDSARSQIFNAVTTVAPGGKIYARVTARNQGFQTWNQSNTYIGTWNGQDRDSQFYDSSWPAPHRPAKLIQATVAPGEMGTFEFTMTAPSSPGSYREYFNLLVEGSTWMNDQGLYFPVNVVRPVGPNNTSNTGLPSGGTLTKGTSLLSPDTQSILNFQTDGNLVLFENFKGVWSTGTAGQTSTNFVMQPDGNLVLYDASSRAIWTSNTYGNTGAKLSIDTNGALQIKNTANSVIWTSATEQNPDHLGYVNSQLSTNFTLYTGQSTETADRNYHLVLQPDGNLVLYSPRRAIWSSNTYGKPAAKLAMQSDGNLVLYDKNGFAIWQSGTNGHLQSNLLVQPDGNAVVYNGAGTPVWSTVTHNVQ